MKYVITIAEGLLKPQRDYISEVFRCPVYRDYSASECMRMGFGCKCQNGYHMDIYNYYFEYLDGSGYAKENTIGEIVVTNLNNYVFPFVRYRIGDLGEPCRRVCRCGTNLPMVSTLCGRSSDIITTPAGKDLTMRFFEVFFQYLDKYVRQFQVVQTTPEELVVRIVPTERMNESVSEHIQEEILNYAERSMTVKIVRVEEIEMETTGKRQLMVPLRRP
jgi:phenylacetate-CoA ligase